MPSNFLYCEKNINLMSKFRPNPIASVATMKSTSPFSNRLTCLFLASGDSAPVTIETPPFTCFNFSAIW